jgi:hypothetical protein
MKGAIRSALLIAAILAALAAVVPSGATALGLQSGDNERCLRCHAQPGLGTITVNGVRKSLTVDLTGWHASVHSRMDCTACHAGFKPALHTAAETAGWYLQAKLNACSDCHADQFSMYKGSFHGNLVMDERSKSAPACGDCHGSHAIISVTSPDFRGSILPMCSRCHGEKSATYLDTYHGKSFRLGNERTAVCTDCHGHHKILPPSDPQSTLSSQNIAQTCRQCHPSANRLFATYLVHVNRSTPKSSLWVWLMEINHSILIGALFLVGGAHTVLYCYRGLKEGMYRRGYR